jgi:hypothetical protein
VLRRSVILPDSHMSAPILRECGPWMASALVIVIVLSAGLSLAPSALADPAANLRDAVTSARSGTSCGPLRYNPVVQQVAEVINRSTDDYLNHAATRVPILDPLEGLKDLGYRGTKAYLLQGADRSDALAIKGALLEGYAAIPDCSYTDFGVSMRRNETTGYNLASSVLAQA